MAFWTSETIKRRQESHKIISIGYDEGNVENCAYELSLGDQIFISSEGRKTELYDNDMISIPPGQFAMLLTSETVNIPHDTLAFISLKFRFKKKGLVNVSGFHVDPGFHSKLKFAVYNAGGREICVCRGDCLFQIWFADLDMTTKDVYENSRKNEFINPGDQEWMAGDLASPAVLSRKLESQSSRLKTLTIIFSILVSVFVGFIIIALGIGNLGFKALSAAPEFSEEFRQQLKWEIKAELRSEGFIAGEPAENK